MDALILFGAISFGIAALVAFGLLWPDFPRGGPLRNIYIALAALLVVGLSLPDSLDKRLSGIGANLVTEVVGIGITVFVIERAFRSQAKEREKKYAHNAHRKIHRALASHAHEWQLIFLSCKFELKPIGTPDRKDGQPVLPKICDYRYPENYARLKHFDLNAPTSYYPPELYRYHLPRELSRFREKLFNVVDAYAMFLDPEDLEKVEKLAHSDVITFLPRMIQIGEGMPPAQQIRHPFFANVEGVEKVPEFIRYHLDMLVELIERTNYAAEEHERVDLWIPRN